MCSQNKEGFSCCTEPLPHVLQWRKVEHSSCHFTLWGFLLAADVEETSQSWGSFSVNIDLWQKKRMDFRKNIPVFRVLLFPVWSCTCLYYIASRRDEVCRVLCMKMHICDAHLSLLPWSSTWKAGREIKAGVLEGRRRNSTVTQAWSTASPLLLLPLHQSRVVIPQEPACNPVTSGWELLLLHPLHWSEWEHCCVLTTHVDAVPGFVFPFHPMVL